MGHLWQLLQVVGLLPAQAALLAELPSAQPVHLEARRLRVLGLAVMQEVSQLLVELLPAQVLVESFHQHSRPAGGN